MLEAFIADKDGVDSQNGRETTTRGARETDGRPASSSLLGLQSCVCLDLLYACLKLFITRPPEMQRTLGKLFHLVSAVYDKRGLILSSLRVAAFDLVELRKCHLHRLLLFLRQR